MKKLTEYYDAMMHDEYGLSVPAYKQIPRGKMYLIPAAVADAVVAVFDALDEVTFFGTCIGKSDCRFDEKCTDGESECEYYKLKQARDKYKEVSNDR